MDSDEIFEDVSLVDELGRGRNLKDSPTSQLTSRISAKSLKLESKFESPDLDEIFEVS